MSANSNNNKEKLQRILEGNTEISPQQMQAYLEGKLPPSAHYEVERQLLNSDFATEALEGYEQAEGKINIPVINKKLHKDIRQYNRERGYGTDYRVWYAAASIVLLFVITIGIWTIEKKKTNESMNMQTKKEIVHSDALTTEQKDSKYSTGADSAIFSNNVDSSKENLAFNQTQEQRKEQATTSKIATPTTQHQRAASAKREKQGFATSDVWIEKVEDVATHTTIADDNDTPAANASDEDSEVIPDESSKHKKKSNNTLDEAMRTFEQKSYARASLLFDTYLQENPDDAEALFYAGMSAYLHSDYKKAIPFFEKFMTLTNSLKYHKNHDEATWNLANAYQKTGNKAKARQLFAQLASSESKYAGRAKQKLKK